jgi:transposase
MALRTVTMAELRLEVLLEAERSGESVAEICRRYKISRETYYRYRRRYLAAGIEGLEDQSRRPKRSPAQINAELEAEICRMRRAHPRWGARRIHGELRKAGVEPPAVSTIHRVCSRLVGRSRRRAARRHARIRRCLIGRGAVRATARCEEKQNECERDPDATDTEPPSVDAHRPNLPPAISRRAPKRARQARRPGRDTRHGRWQKQRLSGTTEEGSRTRVRNYT